jgi:osomolarity two-component system response regulator SKN7
MNDVLAKPFTREGMVRILRKHLTRMLKDPQSGAVVGGGDDLGQAVAGGHPPPHQGGYGPAAMGGMAQVKFEHTPIQSPSTASSWHSPSQMHQTSPNLDGTGGGPGGGYMNAVGSGPGGMVLTPGGSQQQQQQRAPSQTQHHPHHHPQQQGGYPGYMTPQQVAGAQAAQAAQAQAQAQAMRGMAENARMQGMQVAGSASEDRPEKRQRLYGPVPGQGGGGGYVQ